VPLPVIGLIFAGTAALGEATTSRKIMIQRTLGALLLFGAILLILMG
jgi:hypothetical protein